MSKVDIKELFHGMQQQMEAQLSTNRNFIEHPGSKGDALEEVWIEWLRKYLPNRYCADKAIVIDIDGDTSDQIDVVIYDQHFTPFVLNQNGFKYVPAEGVYAVFEVKPDVEGYVKSKHFIEYAGDKIASVRKLKRTSTQIINAGRMVPARPLAEIVGGMLTSTNTIVKNKTIEAHLKAQSGLSGLDLLCAIDKGAILLDYSAPYTDSNGVPKKEINAAIWDYYKTRAVSAVIHCPAENSLIAFFFKLMEYLQQRIGTVAAIDLDAYAISAGFSMEPDKKSSTA